MLQLQNLLRLLKSSYLDNQESKPYRLGFIFHLSYPSISNQSQYLLLQLLQRLPSESFSQVLRQLI